MTPPRPGSIPLDAETLLAHSAWLSRFARALVARESEIDDVVQQTFVRALAQPPQHARNLRGWLATIARNVVRSNARSDVARVAREVAAPLLPRVESPVEALERAELRKLVVESVLALEEPYRTAVVLRFFEEQDVASVARLTKAPEDTVRTRLRRGVLRVRELLERKVDDRSRGSADEGAAARAILFVRLGEIAANGEGAASGSAAGSGAAIDAATATGARLASVAATRRITVSAAAVIVGAAGWWWWERTRTNPLPTETSAHRAESPASVPPEREAAPSAAVAERASESEPTTPAAEAPITPRPVARGTLRGAITGPDGNPVAGARVWAIVTPSHETEDSMPDFGMSARGEAERDPSLHGIGEWIGTTCDGEGKYEISGLRTMPGWAVGAYEPTVGANISEVRSFDREHRAHVVDVKLIPGAILRGSVRDEDGTPIGAARVFLFTTCGKRTTRATIVTIPSGPDVGEFDIGFRCGDSLEIGCSTPGFVATKRSKVEIPPRARDVTIPFTLQRKPGSVVRGPIVDAKGLSFDLEPLLNSRFALASPSARALKASVWAIVDGAKLPPTLLAGVATGDEVIEGRIDFVEGEYEVVVPDGFHGALELRIFQTLVGKARLDVPGDPPDLPCDEHLLPVEEDPGTFAVRFVDSESKAPIDLGQEDLLPQASDGETFAPIVESASDARQGIVRYRCGPGYLEIEPLVRGYAMSLISLEVPRGVQPAPLDLELARANAGVRGRALHADGGAIASAPISIFRLTVAGAVDTTGPYSITNADGEFEFPALAKGEHVIVVSGQPDEAPGLVRFLAAEPFPEVEVRTTPGTATRLRIVRRPNVIGAGRPLLRIFDRDGLQLERLRRSWTFAPDSPNEITATLRDGRYTVAVEIDGLGEARIGFDVPAPGPIEIPVERDEGTRK